MLRGSQIVLQCYILQTYWQPLKVSLTFVFANATVSQQPLDFQKCIPLEITEVPILSNQIVYNIDYS